jgi:hypothetical protein
MMRAKDIEPGRYYVVRLSAGVEDDVRAERVEPRVPPEYGRSENVLVATRHFALHDMETRHSLREVLRPSDPDEIERLQRFLERRDAILNAIVAESDA